jgi:hypothetical protein
MSTKTNQHLKYVVFVLLGLLILLLTACGGGSSTPPTSILTSDANFLSTHFSGSGNCTNCHNGLTDGAANDVSIESDWSTSMMANSTRDPFWRAKVASEMQRNPQFKALLGDKCSRCHAPMASVEAKFEGSTVELFGDGFLNPQNAYYNLGMDGVSCTACHQIEDDGNLGTLNGFSGKFSIVDLGTNAERTAFGQYADPVANPMFNNTGIWPTYAAHISTSEMCATCHNLKTPFVDSSGVVASTTPESEFPEQMIYTEWENSSFASGTTAQSCQDCHMPKTDGVTISTRPNFLAARNDFSRHTLVGANTTMLDILSRNKVELGVTADGFDTAITRTRAMLASAADIEIVSQNLVGDELTVQLRVNNRSGHKLPSGYPSRRVYIHFIVRDDTGDIIFESGKTNSDGSIVAADADTNLSLYESHYDEITQQDQVQIYEAIMSDTDSNVTYTLLRAASYLKDNRLPPAGFDKNVVVDDVRVWGEAMADNNFNSGSDLVTYKINIGSASINTIHYTAELKYQSLAYGFVKDLFLDNNNPEVAKFETLYNDSTIRSETISVISGTL